MNKERGEESPQENPVPHFWKKKKAIKQQVRMSENVFVKIKVNTYGLHGMQNYLKVQKHTENT